jgi:Arc/MetJ-type ribon-helix-helix transcriptional regulator
MSKQIAVRLPDDLVEFLDQVVCDGDGSSRAAVVKRALERERRRRIAERDVAILIATADQDDDDMDSLARYASRTPLDDLA